MVFDKNSHLTLFQFNVFLSLAIDLNVLNHSTYVDLQYNIIILNYTKPNTQDF